MRCVFLVYQKDDHVGNDLTNQDPFKWIIAQRKKYPESELVVHRWLEINVPQYEYDGLQAQIGIEYDEAKKENPKSVEAVEEVLGGQKKVKRPRGWVLMNEFVDDEGNVFHKGIEKPDLKGTRPKTLPRE